MTNVDAGGAPDSCSQCSQARAPAAGCVHGCRHQPRDGLAVTAGFGAAGTSRLATVWAAAADWSRAKALRAVRGRLLSKLGFARIKTVRDEGYQLAGN